MKSIGLCIIGAGAISNRHMQAFQQLAGVTPTWVVSQPHESAQDFAHRWNFPNVATTASEALADPNVQLVLIASPSPFHSDQALQALSAGKDVIVEIPVALSWQEAQSVAAAAAKIGRRVWVCHTLRSTPALRLVREHIRNGQMHLTHITGFFAIPRRRNQGMDGIGTRTWIDNLLWHHGCHQIDASLWVLGMPSVTRVQSLFGPSHPTLGMALDVGIQMATTGGELITHSLTYNTERGVWRLQFIGHEDVLTFEDGRLTNESGQELVPSTPVADLTVQDGEILHSCRTGQPSDYDLPTILPTMAILNQAQTSAT